MSVFEQDTIHIRFVKQFLTALANAGQIFLMDHFIALDVKEPVAGTGRLGDIGLVGMFHPAGELIQVPYGIDNPDLGGPDTFDLFEGMVIRIAIPQGDDKLVNKGQDRADRLLDGVVQFGGIAHHGKSANGHSPVFIIYWISRT
jgi:hypothetical protein